MKIEILFLRILVIFLFITLIIVVKQKDLTNKQIYEIISKNSPKAEDMNKRFEKLYQKFGNGKSIPYKFINGSKFEWKEIYYNIDFLTQE